MEGKYPPLEGYPVIPISNNECPLPAENNNEQYNKNQHLEYPTFEEVGMRNQINMPPQSGMMPQPESTPQPENNPQKENTAEEKPKKKKKKGFLGFLKKVGDVIIEIGNAIEESERYAQNNAQTKNEAESKVIQDEQNIKVPGISFVKYQQQIANSQSSQPQQNLYYQNINQKFQNPQQNLYNPNPNQNFQYPQNLNNFQPFTQNLMIFDRHQLMQFYSVHCGGCELMNVPGIGCQQDNIFLCYNCVNIVTSCQPRMVHFHPLKVVTKINWRCDECREMKSGISFNCQDCKFDCCVKCHFI